MIKWLTALGGGEIIIIWGLSVALASGVSYVKGAEHKANEIAAAGIEEDNHLDTLSGNLSIDTGKIVDGLEDRINVRVTGVNQQALDDVEAAAEKTGRLLGKAEGYKKGFEDAKNIIGTCYGDPKFLPDSLRVDAQSRYKSVFGSKKTN